MGKAKTSRTSRVDPVVHAVTASDQLLWKLVPKLSLSRRPSFLIETLPCELAVPSSQEVSHDGLW